MLQNAYFLPKIGADTAENEQHFAEILPKTSNYHQLPYLRDGDAGEGRVAARSTHEARGIARRCG